MKKVTLLMAAAAMLFAACCNKQEVPQTDPAEVVMQNILNRKSVRSYTGDTIPAAVMENLLRAAMAAPSGIDARPWQFVVLTDKSQYETIFEGKGNMKKFMECYEMKRFTITLPKATTELLCRQGSRHYLG